MAAYTTIDDPSAHYQTVLYTGNATDATAITNGGNSNLKPDLLIIKNRGAAHWHQVFDSTRGADARISHNASGAEATEASALNTFDTDGFTLGDGQDNGSAANTTNNDGASYVAWQWKANGGSTSSNTDGNITTTLQANTTAGFSFFTYTSNNSATGTLGHGLGAVPHFFVVKSRSNTHNWKVYHHKLASDPETDHVILNETGALVDDDTHWNDTAPTSSVISVGNHTNTNGATSKTYVMYVWTEIQGYSKFGHYEGNGSADGPFVYTGFKPAVIIIKNIDASGDWTMTDNKRETTNDGVDTVNFCNLGDAEASGYALDKLSNGFKIRNTGSARNTDAQTHIYLAFAENPFVTSEGIPATAF